MLTQLALVDYRRARLAAEQALAAGAVPAATRDGLAAAVAALDALRRQRQLAPMSQVVQLYEGQALLARLAARAGG